MSAHILRAFRQGQNASSNLQPTTINSHPESKAQTPDSPPLQASPAKPKPVLPKPIVRRPPPAPELVRPKVEVDPMLTEKQAAYILGRKPRALNKWRQRGLGPTFVRYPDGVIRYPYAPLKAFRDKYIVNL